MRLHRLGRLVGARQQRHKLRRVVDEKFGRFHHGVVQRRLSHADISLNSTRLVTSRLDTNRHVRLVERVETSVSSASSCACTNMVDDTTRHVRRVESMHFGCVELVALLDTLDTTSSTRSTRSTRQARLGT